MVSVCMHAYNISLSVSLVVLNHVHFVYNMHLSFKVCFYPMKYTLIHYKLIFLRLDGRNDAFKPTILCFYA